MKLQTNEYQLNYLSVRLPEELITAEVISALQSVAVDEFARLKDGIEVPYDSLSELEIEKEIDQTLADFVSYLLNNWKHIDVFIFIP